MENVILPLSSSKPFISYQLYGTKLFFFRPAKINCFRLLAFLFSAHPVLSNCSDSFQPNFRLKVHVLPCFPSAASCEKKKRSQTPVYCRHEQGDEQCILEISRILAQYNLIKFCKMPWFSPPRSLLKMGSEYREKFINNTICLLPHCFIFSSTDNIRRVFTP